MLVLFRNSGHIAASMGRSPLEVKPMNRQLLQPPTPEMKKALVGQGVGFLKMFHDDYRRNRESRSMEYQRGIVTGWRFTVDLLYGERVGEEIADAASEEANLTIPSA